MKIVPGNVYHQLPLSSINYYGDHKGILPGVHKRIASVLYWSEDYNLRNLAEYYWEWAHYNSQEDVDLACCADQDIFHTVKAVFQLKNINELSSREIACFVVLFRHSTYREQLALEFSKYLEGKNSSLSPDLWASIERVTQEDYIFEPTCSLCGYLYRSFPIMETTLTGLTASLLFPSFWAMFLALSLAELSVTIVGGLLSGAWNSQEDGILLGALQGLEKRWDQKVSTDNSFHPIVDAAFVGLYIACSWAWINKLEKDASEGSLLYILVRYGISNFVLKYSAMNFFFTIKAQLLQGKIDASSLIKNTITGAIRGLLRNAMLKYFIDPIQWSVALSLQQYTSFSSQAYLKEWRINQVIGNTYFASTLFWLLKDSPEKLILALSLIKEIIEINITNLSKSMAMLVMAVLCALIQKANAYPYTALIVIIASYIAYNNIEAQSLFL